MKFYFVVFCVTIFSLLSKSVNAEIEVVYPVPLSRNIQQADVILLARISKYELDKNELQKLLPAKEAVQLSNKPKLSSQVLGKVFTTTKFAGEYSFEVVKVLKGVIDISKPLPLRIARISWWNYGLAQSLSVEIGDTTLIFLKKENETFTPVNPSVPFYLLSQHGKQVDLTQSQEIPAQDKIIRLLLASLTDQVLRQVNTHFLSRTQNSYLVSELVPYLHDPNPRVHDNVLYCMAVNQQVAAIPRIAQLVREQAKEGGGVQAATALQKYTTPDAIPYLNLMLFEVDQYVRLNSLSALSNMANRSTTPYLLLAVRDPEWQNMVAPGASAILHKLIPELGGYPGQEQFLAKRSEFITRYQEWWRDELSGKHASDLKTGEATAVRRTLPDLTKLKPAEALPLLHQLLFEPTLKTRQEAITALEKLADRSSVPYLLIAMIDPDSTIAYTAYKKLFRLVDGLGLGQTRQQFEANPETAAKPLYDWWRDELQGKHITVQSTNTPVVRNN